MKKLPAALAVTAFLIGLTASPATAAVEFGSNCTAVEVEPGLTFVDLAHSAGQPLPVTAPISGVIVAGKTSIDPALDVTGQTETLHVYRPAGADRFTLVGESQPAPLRPGANTFATRVPVQVGDHLGFSNSAESGQDGLICRTENPGDGVAYTDQPPAIGGSAEFGSAPGYLAPLAAVIEPDADNDGFGDETQDGCPQSAAFQTVCPLVEVDSSAKAGKKAVVIKINASSEGTVGVKGVVKLGKGKKATLKAKAKTVFAGKTATFRLKFNAKLLGRLNELPPSQKLTLKVTATAKNLAGQVTKDRLKVKLKGQATA